MQADEDVLFAQLEKLLPIRVRLLQKNGSERARFFVTDQHNQEVKTEGASPLLIMAILRKKGLQETYEIGGFGESVIVINKKPPPRPPPEGWEEFTKYFF
jgi:hypothetical protein